MILKHLGTKVNHIRITADGILHQDRVQYLNHPNIDKQPKIISYAQINNVSGGGIKFLAYLERFGHSKITLQSATISASKISLDDWSETSLFENVSMTMQANRIYTLDKTNADLGFDNSGEFCILMLVNLYYRGNSYKDKKYVSDIGIYEYADFLRRKISFLQITKKDAP